MGGASDYRQRTSWILSLFFPLIIFTGLFKVKQQKQLFQEITLTSNIVVKNTLIDKPINMKIASLALVCNYDS